MESAKVVLSTLSHVNLLTLRGKDVSGADLSDAMKGIVSVESLKLDFISFKDGDADVTFEALTTVNMLMYTPQSNSLPTTMENPTQKYGSSGPSAL